MSEEECKPLRQSYDVTGEQVYNRLNEISPPPKTGELPRNNPRQSEKTESGFDSKTVNEDEKQYGQQPKTPSRDLYAILRDNRKGDPLLEKFWDEVSTVPDWVDWDQIARGQDVFYRYGGATITGLAYQSLLGGMGAARVVETLARTGGFSVKVARGRLFETMQHILQVTKTLESLQPGGDGWASTIRVRLLHAAVRARIMKLASTRPSYYDVSANGVPINDLDSIATITTFSATLIWMSLPRQGIFLRAHEITDYVALWRYVGYVIGCPVSPYFATPTKAKAMMETLYYHEIRPSATGRILANNIIKSLHNQPPAYASADFLAASARWLNGNALSDELGLPSPSWYYWALMAGQCAFFCCLIYMNRSVPSWDKRKLELVRRLMWSVIVDSKFGLQGEMTSFELKYVPEYATITEMGESDAKGDRGYDVEGRNLRWFGYTLAALGVGSYVGVKLTLWGIRMMVGLWHLVW